MERRPPLPPSCAVFITQVKDRKTVPSPNESRKGYLVDSEQMSCHLYSNELNEVIPFMMPSFVNTPRSRIENDILKGEEVARPKDYWNFGKFVLDSLEKDLDFVGQINTVTGEEYTYGKVRELSVRCALWMRSQGLLPGEVVAICSNDHLDFAIPCYATLYLGAIFTLWGEGSDADAFLHQMNVTKPKIVFADGVRAVMISEVAKKAKLESKIISFGHVPGFLDFKSVIAEPNLTEVKEFKCTTINSPGEIASILFSSGSTGLPKGVAISYEAFMMVMQQSDGAGMAGNVCFVVSATHWLLMTYSMFMTMFWKTPRMILPRFEPNLFCALIEKYKVNWVQMNPWNINRLVKCDGISRYDLSSLKRIVHSGGVISATSCKALKKLLPKIQSISAYGLTETSGYLTVQSLNSPPGSCGYIMANRQLKVIDPETGRTLRANQKGELLTKNDFNMSFYYNNPEATAEAIDEEGWLHTGDLGYYDDNGEIFMIDRLKDIIRFENTDICPSGIESVILSLPGVKEVAVVGKPRDQDEDILIAFVVRAEDSSETSKPVTEIEILNRVAAELPESLQLRAGVRFVDRLPRTPTGKIRRDVLRDLAKSTQ